MSRDEPLNWEVFDMAHDHRYCLDEDHPAEFGPMSERQAKAMQESNPRGYWARKIPSRG